MIGWHRLDTRKILQCSLCISTGPENDTAADGWSTFQDTAECTSSVPSSSLKEPFNAGLPKPIETLNRNLVDYCSIDSTPKA